MKTALYVTLLVVLVFAGLSIVTLYYTQDFSSSINFEDTINLKDIKADTRVEVTTAYNSDGTYEETNTTYLISAKAQIGEIKLTNKGIFEQTYYVPQMVGCINTASSLTDYGKELQFAIGTEDNANYYGYYNNENKIVIGVGETKNLPLYANYYSGSALLSDFTNGNVKNLTVYVLDKKENNPLGESYYYGSNYYSCDELKRMHDPVQTIVVL